MGFNKIINHFLAGILIIIYHLFMGMLIPRDSVAFSVSLYIFILTMIYLIGLPVDEETGEIQEQDINLGPY